MGVCAPLSMSLMERDGLRGDDGVVGVAAGDDENFAVGIVGIGAHGHGGRCWRTRD